MTKNQPKRNRTYKYNNGSLLDLDELAEQWVEMLFETLLKSSLSRLERERILTDNRNKKSAST
ncbi:hypothetical protein A3A75_05575 [Candidatus Woesebacteria bacterium RIFCSPLOWO2_01_FULL_39_10]|uniref:Uncharacterized protein n=1 Tax=Candidatus Woesebacteria bacterium RIFCSPLOWO2_01_FULL_39_10 TaxID=1802516 RepID=A0A1F8B5X0_9BACT|nr:MAG: hypothetical protein A3A75_05575 [Candidatus Woesebacteria bacterium RIFCSPLOWO2_01_FULL_39_10]